LGDSHFWGDRFHSRILDSIRQFVMAFGYIDDNPVKAGLAASACEWRHAGAWHRRTGDASILDAAAPWLSMLERVRPLPIAIPEAT
jgi:hypothetical protein